ncbi:DNA polymerase III, epsilon subunit domain protein [Mycobacterium xenopi 4042]|uniref:DNA polymerase III, epsilon subunit domain protein n=2 Tax=Mycobacterium xenopi TaxID=1789 RepID=X8DBP4_MYCXE|nr:DNA polymerase III, epsilon subunit domain protein [Mycobacterium xenopi 4042]
MNVCRPGIHTGIEQTDNGTLDYADWGHGEGSQTYHPRCSRMHPRCLDIDDSPTSMAIEWPLVDHADSISAPTDIEAGSSHRAAREWPDKPAYRRTCLQDLNVSQFNCYRRHFTHEEDEGKWIRTRDAGAAM